MDFLFQYISLFSQNLSQIGARGPFYVIWFLIKNGGWIFLVWIFFNNFFKEWWLNQRQAKFAKKVKWCYLAIDVPKDNEQSPKAVEQIFNQLWGAIKGPNFAEKWWDGYFQLAFSLEIVSIEGYIQYIIRTPKQFRDLVEAAVYAQYPDADITEIEDYTTDFTPKNFKQHGYDLWGAQFEFSNKEYYPIRTYPLFEHSIAQKIIDPMSALLEMMSKLGKGEQLWYQIIIKPVGDDTWKPQADELVKELIGAEAKKEKSKVDNFLDKIFLTFNFMFPTYKQEIKKESALPSKVLYMSKGEIETVSAIEIKSNKTGFKCKLRMIYIAKKDVFSKTRGVSPFVGALKQYSAGNLNSFKPSKEIVTKAEYYRVEPRLHKKQRKVLSHFKSRSIYSGTISNGYILNVEELASLYHFPTIEVGTASVKKAESKKAPPPMTVPEEILEQVMEPIAEEVKASSRGVAPPIDLPV